MIVDDGLEVDNDRRLLGAREPVGTSAVLIIVIKNSDRRYGRSGLQTENGLGAYQRQITSPATVTSHGKYLA